MRLLDHDGVTAKIGPRSPTTTWRHVKKDRFPPPVKSGGGRLMWPEGEIDAYILWRIALRDHTTSAECWSEWWRPKLTRKPLPNEKTRPDEGRVLF